MRVRQEDLIPGMHVYHAYVFPEREGSNCAWIELQRYVGPDMSGWVDFALFDDVGSLTYDEVQGHWKFWVKGKARQSHSLHDMGIIDNHYNHHRTFSTLEEAWNYVLETCAVEHWPTPGEDEKMWSYVKPADVTGLVQRSDEKDMVADDVAAERSSVDREREDERRAALLETADEYVPQSIIDAIYKLDDYEADRFFEWLESEREHDQLAVIAQLTRERQRK